MARGKKKKSLREEYHPYLRACMAFKNGVASYPKPKKFSQEELLTLTPDIMARWMKNRAYGMPDPGPDD